jgi:hypothetical protein
MIVSEFQLKHCPVHLVRQLDQVITKGQEEAIQQIQQHILPEVWRVRQKYGITWVAHVAQAGEQNLVIPEVFWSTNQELWHRAGFRKVERKQDTPSQDGLREALLGGSNMEKPQW